MTAGHDLPRNIGLIGFMGSGKTTVGRALSEQLGWAFTDTDAWISERAQGRSVADLFAADGEAGFRRLEADALRAVCAGDAQVIATGGGAVLHANNVAALRRACLVIWLTARPDVVVARTRAAAPLRPLLADHAGSDHALLTHILRLLGERGPLYQAAAHLIVDTSDREPSAIAAEIRRKAARWAAAPPPGAAP